MIEGQINARREALIPVRIRGASGAEAEVQAVLDTGFDDHLMLPAEMIEGLGLIRQGAMPLMMADGSIVRASVFEAVVMWNGERRTTSVQATKNDTLVGMRLLQGSLVTLEVVDGGAVTIEPLE
jgi:clan AA aspartic protease